MTAKKTLYVEGKFNSVYINQRKNGSFFLSDDLSDDTIEFDLEYIKQVGADLAVAIKHSAAEFIYMHYLNPVETFDEDGLYGA
ncbi:hypothetical protein PHYNN_155 [Pantoea phage Phynn]|nr:hypothetical protein PHYNN_155 [Pantoea phage Phynn]